jgi:hypothetical protein
MIRIWMIRIRMVRVPVIRVPVVQERLQDQGGCDLVNHAAMVLAGAAGLVEDLVGFAGGHPLVPEMDGDTGEFSQFGREGPGALGAVTRLARKMEWVPDHDGGDAEPPRQARQRAHILARIPPPQQGQDGLGRQPQFVGDGYADAFRSDVEAEIARLGLSFQRSTPCQQLNARPGLTGLAPFAVREQGA